MKEARIKPCAGVQASEEALHPPHGADVRPGNRSREESTGTSHFHHERGLFSQVNSLSTFRLRSQLLLKVQTSSLFKGKKENYPLSVCRPFLDTRIGESESFSVLN